VTLCILGVPGFLAWFNFILSDFVIYLFWMGYQILTEVARVLRKDMRFVWLTRNIVNDAVVAVARVGIGRS